jgi:hypothetical protein
VVDLVTAIGTGAAPSPSFADGLQVQQVLAAVERSAEHGSGWEQVALDQRADHQAGTSPLTQAGVAAV